MKLFWKTLKWIGILLFIAIAYVGTVIYCLVSINKDLQQDSVAETKEKFGDFEDGQLIKKIEISPIKRWIIGSASFYNKGYKTLTEINLYTIAYKSDGLIVTGLLAEPKETGNYPCLIYNRGGNRNAGRLSFRQAYFFMIPYAIKGYTVIASNYRGNSGSEGKEEFGGSDVNDIFNLIPALSQIDNADTSRIGLLGHSRGGMMTYKAMQHQGVFKTAVVMAGSADKFNSIEKRPNMEKYVYGEIIPDYYQHKDSLLRDRSVVHWPEKLDQIPLLILHGTADKRVTYNEAELIAHKLDSTNHPYQLISFEGDDHGFSKHRRESVKKVLSWLDKYLRQGVPYQESERRIIIP